MKQQVYWPQLDGLRFFAALSVFAAHADCLPWVRAFVHQLGWIGVDLFLVLSAFLLTRLLKIEMELSGRVDIGHYFTRRILRIWPLHWAFVTVMLVFVAVVHRDALREAAGLWLSHIAFFNNVVITRCDWNFALPFSTHLWTISLEEQFYLMVPFVVPVLIKIQGSRKALLLIGWGLAVLTLAKAACVLLGVSGTFIMTLPLRCDAMFLGMALGAGFLEGLTKGRRSIYCAVIGGVTLCLATSLPPVGICGWHQVYGYVLIDSACLLLVAGILTENGLSRCLACRPLRYLGKISYGLYVYHLVRIAIARKIMESLAIESLWLRAALALALTIGIAGVSYHFYEKRFLKLKDRFAVVLSRPA